MNRIPPIFATAFLPGRTLRGSLAHWRPRSNTALGVIIALGLDRVIGAVTLAQVEYRRRGEAGVNTYSLGQLRAKGSWVAIELDTNRSRNRP